MIARGAHIDFRHDPEPGVQLLAGKRPDLTGSAGFLPPELVARKRQDFEPMAVVFVVQMVEVLEGRRAASVNKLMGSVHHMGSKTELGNMSAWQGGCTGE